LRLPQQQSVFVIRCASPKLSSAEYSTISIQSRHTVSLSLHRV
jgi:hypothetical protein